MYSATAIDVAKLRAKVARLSRDQDRIAVVLLPMYRDRLRVAQARLIAERDPEQREALRLADAQDRAQTRQIARKFYAVMAKISAPIAHAMGKIKSVTHTAFARAAAMMERAKAKREAVRLSYTAVVSVVLTPKTITPRCFASGEATSTEVEPLLDLQVHSLIAAPRPGPLAGTALAAA